MLYFIAAWVLLTLVCTVIGTGVLCWLTGRWFEQWGDRWLLSLWLGVVLLAVSLLAVSLVLPLTPLVGIGVALAWVSVVWAFPAARFELQHLWQNRPLALGWVFAGCAIAAALLTTQTITWIDTGLYHYSTIQWLARFGAVPGLALLFSNLGFTSSWFALAAPFNPPLLGARATAITNGFVCLIVLLQIAIALRHCWKRSPRPSDWFLLAFSVLIVLPTLGYRLIAEILVSPSPDLPVMVLVGTIAWSILLICNTPAYLPEAKSAMPAAVPLVLAVGAVTMKLVAIPLLLVAIAFFVAAHYKQWQKLGLGGAIVLLMLSPMVLAGLVSSGCPLYPATAFCLDVPWAPASERLERIADNTHGWLEKLGNDAPPGVPLVAWRFWRWLTSAKENIIMSLVALLTLASSLLLLKPLLKSSVRGWWWLGAIALLGMGFLAVTSPMFRFGYPYILLIPLVFLTIYSHANSTQIHQNLQFIQQKLSRLNRRPLIFLAVSLSILVSILLYQSVSTRFLLPPPLRQVATTSKQTNDVFYRDPNDGLCWATEIPCAFDVPGDVRLRDSAAGLKGGFVREPSTRKPAQ